MVFHLANADMLPLVGQKLALQNKNEGTAFMAGCTLLAQVVMVPMAMMVGRKADFSGRKPLFLAGLAVLCLRGLLYPLSDNRFWLFAVQSLDGIRDITKSIKPNISQPSKGLPVGYCTTVSVGILRGCGPRT